MVRFCTENLDFEVHRGRNQPCKMLINSLLMPLSRPRHSRCPRWNTKGDLMFDFKQLYIGGAVMALAEVVTLVIMVATR